MSTPFNDIPATTCRIQSSRGELSIGTFKDQDQSTSYLFYNQSGAEITLRYTQLLFNPITMNVAAAEVEQTQRGDLWNVSGDWRFYNGRAMTRKNRRSSQPTIDEIVIPISSSTSSSSCASSYSSLSSDESEDMSEAMSELQLPWEELIQDAFDLAAHNNDDDWAFQQYGEGATTWINEGEVMPFVMSELPLSFDGDWIDEDDELHGLALLEDTYSNYSGCDVSSTVVACQKKTRKPRRDIRWKQLAQRLADSFDREDIAKVLLLIFSSGNPGAWCAFDSRREKTANAYESL